MRWILVLVVLFSNLGNSFAGQNYYYKAGEVIRAYISASSMNRIEFKGCSALEVVGDESKYQLVTDKVGQNLFIMPKVRAGEKFNLSIIGTSGQVQDFEFVVSNIGSQSLGVDFAYLKEGSYLDYKEVAEMLRSMKSGARGKYFVETHNKKLASSIVSSNHPGLEILKQTTYRFGDLTGVVLLVKNKSKASAYLQEEEFSRIFKGTLATNIGSNLLPAGKSASVTIVTKERE